MPPTDPRAPQPSKSQIRHNAERDPTYCPYCMRCSGLLRMWIIEPFYWRCFCGATHDERTPPVPPSPVSGEAPTLNPTINSVEIDSSASVSEGATPVDREIIARVDRWFGGALCIAFKSHHEGRPNEPAVYLYRSAVLAGLGVREDDHAA